MRSLGATAPAIALGLALGMLVPEKTEAEQFDTVQSRDGFVGLIGGRELRRTGIRLNVTPDGQIVGSAFGIAVTGAWTWDGGYFCRDLFFGDRDLGYNCQRVQVNGETMRFTSDQGTGDFADLTLR